MSYCFPYVAALLLTVGTLAKTRAFSHLIDQLSSLLEAFGSRLNSVGKHKVLLATPGLEVLVVRHGLTGLDFGELGDPRYGRWKVS